jgi:hypothetical protein
MPLRDHFHSPLTELASWEELHGAWPTTIAYRLNAILPPEFRSGVKIHLGTTVEIDVGTFQFENGGSAKPGLGPDAALTWQAAAPTVLLETDELTPPEYEVRVYDQTESRRLVATVEIVSPRNKDRVEAREAFVSKCHALLQEQVCVVVVDPVTSRSANLYAELTRRIGARAPATAAEPIYAASCRYRTVGGRVRVESWEHALAVGSELPTLPLWISETRYVPLELERTYEETCRGLRIP